MSLTLVLGGTRSGKSRRAEELALASGRPVRYVATADPGDASMAERIRRHAERRPPDWTAVEAAGDLAGALRDGGECVLIDGLGVWIAGAMHREGAFEEEAGAALARARARVESEIERLVAHAARPEPLIVVAEEAGQGVLPADAASRAWLDLLGEAKLRLADAADRVELVVAGRSLVLAGTPAAPDPALRVHADAELAPGLADHAVSVMAGGPPEWLRDALHDALDGDGGRYPNEGEACAAVAALHDREPEDVVPTNGAAEALWLLPAALRPRLAACVHPAFTEAEAALRAHGVSVERVLRDPERGFALAPDAVPEEADLVIAGNPASPSGTLDPAPALLALRRPGRTIVVDEAFMDLVPGEPATLAGERLDDVIVVRSLTKSMAIPGLRAGYALAAPVLAERLRAVRPPWSVNALALTALAEVARRPEALAGAAARADAERRDLAERLAAMPGLRTWPSAANYCLVEVADGPGVVAALRERGIAVRPAGTFPGLGDNHLRIAARAPAANERLASALAEVLAAEAVEAR
jgi:histidinol-phosphate/aromatic aminotransferase/cobyric acid decarboxylase-like protein/adenosyl cobinamide kinase/adenosyl cobinamide phosphate guanylyltransferase